MNKNDIVVCSDHRSLPLSVGINTKTHLTLNSHLTFLREYTIISTISLAYLEIYLINDSGVGMWYQPEFFKLLSEIREEKLNQLI